MSAWFQKKPPEAEASKEPAKPREGRAGNGLRISQLLGEETILVAPAGLDKNGLLEVLAALICEKKGLSDHPALLAKILEREQGISTTLDTGLSLPHARIDGLSEIVAALAVVGHGIPDPKQPDLLIRVMFMFFSPNKPEAFPLHLQLLRGVSALFQPALIGQLSRAPSRAAALELIRGQEGGAPS